MSVKGIIMFLGMKNIRLERKILIILDFENGFLPTYLPQCVVLIAVLPNCKMSLEIRAADEACFALFVKTYLASNA